MFETAIVLDPAEVRRNVLPLGTWHEWSRRMQAATTFEEKIGLLHVGFDVRLDGAPYRVEYDQLDRLRFYFGLADGWTSNRNFRDPGVLVGEEQLFHGYFDGRGQSIKRSQSEQRQMLATKAFQMLVSHCFKPSLSDYEECVRYDRVDGYHRRVIQSGLLSMVQQFFRHGEDWPNRWTIHNLTTNDERQTPQEKTLVKFLFLLPEVLWRWEETDVHSYHKEEQRRVIEEQNAATREIVEAGKVWMAQVLSCLGRLDLLGSYGIKPGDPCLEALEAIALSTKFSRHDHLVLEDRPAETIEEACLLGSGAAKFVMLRRIEAAERQRLEGIREAELAQRETERAAERRAAEVAAAQTALVQAAARLGELGAASPAN